VCAVKWLEKMKSEKIGIVRSNSEKSLSAKKISLSNNKCNITQARLPCQISAWLQMW